MLRTVYSLTHTTEMRKACQLCDLKQLNTENQEQLNIDNMHSDGN